MSSSKRSFTVVKVNTRTKVKGDANLGGRFESSTPSGAARKAGSKICRMSKIKGQCTVTITIRETTAGSAKKEFSYRVKRVLDPTTVVHNGVEVVHRYTTKVKAL